MRYMEGVVCIRGEIGDIERQEGERGERWIWRWRRHRRGALCYVIYAGMRTAAKRCCAAARARREEEVPAKEPAYGAPCARVIAMFI